MERAVKEPPLPCFAFYFKTSFVFKGDGRCEKLQQNLLGETRNQTYCVVRVCKLDQNAELKRRIEN